MPLHRRPLTDKPIADLLEDVIADVERSGETVVSWQPFGPDLLVVTRPAGCPETPPDAPPAARRQTRKPGPREKR